LGKRPKVSTPLEGGTIKSYGTLERTSVTEKERKGGKKESQHHTRMSQQFWTLGTVKYEGKEAGETAVKTTFNGWEGHIVSEPPRGGGRNQKRPKKMQQAKRRRMGATAIFEVDRLNIK